MLDSLPRSLKIHLAALSSIFILTIINLFISVIGSYGGGLVFSIIFGFCSLLLIFIYAIVIGSNYKVVENPRDPEGSSSSLIDHMLYSRKGYLSVPTGNHIEVNNA